MKFAKLIGLSYKRNLNSSHEVIVKQKRTFEKTNWFADSSKKNINKKSKRRNLG